ncbi:hypothetical protein [Aeromicrobium sp. CTD01-1L150]|uniref:hypothetical protein n=1 Tax=Aeromicrobium sp. CTD01-1L150 TaxID=3341830 RepID=UPI0035C1DFCB
MTMFTPSVTMAARRLAVPGHAAELAFWARRLTEAADEFPGHRHSEVRRPRRGEVQVSLTFASMQEAAVWESSERRRSLMAEGAELTDGTSTVSLALAQPPGKLRTAVVVWLGLFPFALLLNAVGGVALDGLPLLVRTLVTTLVLVPLAVFVGIPVINRLWFRIAGASFGRCDARQRRARSRRRS